MTQQQHIQQLTKIIEGTAKIFDKYMADTVGSETWTSDAGAVIYYMAQEFEAMVKAVEEECKTL